MNFLLLGFGAIVYMFLLVQSSSYEGRTWAQGKRIAGDMQIVYYPITTSFLLGAAEAIYTYPPKGMPRFYNITYIKIIDSGGTIAEMIFEKGGSGSDTVSLHMKTPSLVPLDALIQIWGYHKGYCKESENYINCSSELTTKAGL